MADDLGSKALRSSRMRQIVRTVLLPLPLAGVLILWCSDRSASQPKAAGNLACARGATEFSSLDRTQESKETQQKNQEELTPLTDEERLLNPREMMLNQPDFVADISFFNVDFKNGEAFGGFSFQERVAVKASRFREETRFWVFVGEIGKTTVRLYPQGKVYDDFEPSRGDATVSGVPYPRLLASQSEVVFTALGTIQINGHKCIKIEAAQEGKPTKVYFYAAPDLKNLVIASTMVTPQRRVNQAFSNISLDVPDELVQIPSDYSAIVHDRWTKVETAKVIYKGKPSNNFGVFRAPSGELFIWIQDAYYPWEYLFRPEKQTVEVAFQGLLVTRSGEYVWRTKETEAFSLAGYRNAVPGTISEPAEVKGNSVTFHSFSYDQDNATIEVSW